MNDLHPAEYRFTFTVLENGAPTHADVIATCLEDAYAEVCRDYGTAQLSCVNVVE